MDLNLAILIDGDNIPSAYLKEMMEEVTQYGTPTIKRIYGDWTKPNLSKWKKILLENAITPIQQYGYTTGKNATDSAMIIDAMDILYSQKVDWFFLFSSDSDFTRLAIRLREAGKKVYGMGEKKTPNPFIVACDKFIYIEVLKKWSSVGKDAALVENELDHITAKDIKSISSTISDLADYDGWAFLWDVWTLLLKKQPNFDPRNYWFQKLTPLIKSIWTFEIEQRENQNGRFKLVYVRAKTTKQKNK